MGVRPQAFCISRGRRGDGLCLRLRSPGRHFVVVVRVDAPRPSEPRRWRNGRCGSCQRRRDVMMMNGRHNPHPGSPGVCFPPIYIACLVQRQRAEGGASVCGVSVSFDGFPNSISQCVLFYAFMVALRLDVDHPHPPPSSPWLPSPGPAPVQGRHHERRPGRRPPLLRPQPLPHHSPGGPPSTPMPGAGFPSALVDVTKQFWFLCFVTICKYFNKFQSPQFGIRDGRKSTEAGSNAAALGFCCFLFRFIHHFRCRAKGGTDFVWKKTSHKQFYFERNFVKGSLRKQSTKLNICISSLFSWNCVKIMIMPRLKF